MRNVDFVFPQGQNGGKSQIHDLFIGSHKSEIICEETYEILSAVQEPFSNLTLPVGKRDEDKDSYNLKVRPSGSV